MVVFLDFLDGKNHLGVIVKLSTSKTPSPDVLMQWV